ncbi:unnamed protein product, partial [Rotaria magnacalcarata]
TSIDDQNSDHNIHNEILNVSNQSSALSRVNWQNEKLNNMLPSNNIHQISPTHFSILSIFTILFILQKKTSQIITYI